MENDNIKDIIRISGVKAIIDAKRKLSERDLYQLEYEVALEEQTNLLRNEVRFHRASMRNFLITINWIFVISIIVGAIENKRIAKLITSQNTIFLSIFACFLIFNLALNYLNHFWTKSNYKYLEREEDNKKDKYDKKELKAAIQEFINDNFQKSDEFISFQKILQVFEDKNIIIKNTLLGLTLNEMGFAKKRRKTGFFYGIQIKNAIQ